MHVITPRVLVDFWTEYPDSKGSLKAWFQEAKTARWATSQQVKAQYGTASIINSERVVFNIRGNDYRLVVRINYKSGAVFIRFIGSHSEYDHIDAATV
jgi:mRNA interferase HigB